MKDHPEIRMIVFIVCVCLGCLLTVCFVGIFMYKKCCKKSKQAAANGPVSVIVPSTFTNGCQRNSQTTFIPLVPVHHQQPVANGTAGSRQYSLCPQTDEDTLGAFDPLRIDQPPSYDDLFPLSKRGLDTIEEE